MRRAQVIPARSVTAIHEPSGTTYEAVTQADGRFFIPGMRVGGPYNVTASLTGFNTGRPEQHHADRSALTARLEFTLKVATIAETITVVGQSDPVFSSARTGAATAVMREDLASLPTITGRITDITRLTPQMRRHRARSPVRTTARTTSRWTGRTSTTRSASGVTTGGIGDRTGVAPISLEAIEQVQVNVAPYDVRQGSFTGAGVNTVTRSGTNTITASAYYRTRNEDCDDLTNVDTCSGFVGTDRRGAALQPVELQDEDAGRVGGRPDRQEQAVRVRRLREAGGQCVR